MTDQSITYHKRLRPGKTMKGLLLLTALMFLGVPEEVTAQSRCRVTLQSTVSTSTVQMVEAYVMDAVDERPHFPGGEGAMRRFINSERRYPRAEYEAGVEGRVLCSFIVGADGSISNIGIVRGATPGMNEEAMRIISKMPRWTPGFIGDNRVAVYMLLPIPFRL